MGWVELKGGLIKEGFSEEATLEAALELVDILGRGNSG